MTAPLVPLRRGGAASPEEREAAALLNELASPAVDSAAVDRVWRRLAARKPATRRLTWALAGALTAGIATLALLPLRNAPLPLPAQARVVLLRGTVSHEPADSRWDATAEGDALKPGEQVRSGTTAQALLNIPGIAALLLSEDSQLSVERSPRGVVVHLARGAVTAKVAHRDPGESFVVETAQARVTVVGTLFSVGTGNARATSVSVHEGAVAVTASSGESARVVAGTRWISNQPGRGTDSISPAVATLLEACLLDPNAAALRALFDATQVAQRAPAGAATPSVETAPAAVPVPPAAIVQERTHVATHHVAIAGLSPRLSAVTSQPPVPPSAAEPAADDPYGRAIELEAKGEHAEAAVAFARAAEVDPRHGEPALYELGRLERLRLHDLQKARGAFEQYRKRYPTGTFLPEVDLSILEIDGALGKTDDQLAESELFIADHPADEHVDDVRLSLAHMRRDRGECARALIQYRAITKASRLDDATYSIAYCQAQLGDRAGADQTLHAYLARFPQGAHRSDALKALGTER
jgi:ferric-dicitrate binding protein FerR (iron transport regulator)/tetratricopeptide (TPR) repeat protein